MAVISTSERVFSDHGVHKGGHLALITVFAPLKSGGKPSKQFLEGVICRIALRRSRTYQGTDDDEFSSSKIASKASCMCLLLLAPAIEEPLTALLST